MKILKSNKKGKGSDKQKKDKHFLQELVRENYKNRLHITIITLTTFFLLLAGIGYSMYANTPISSDWKEILLFVLGAFVGSYQQIIQFWFGRDELQQNTLKWAEQEDDKDKSKKKPDTQKCEDCDGEKLLKD